MRTTVTSPIVHRCPHADELDVGTVTMEWDGPAPELHALRKVLEVYATREWTHEEVTAHLASLYPKARIVTRWMTAGCEVSCSI